jgi:hypothetical protein
MAARISDFASMIASLLRVFRPPKPPASRRRGQLRRRLHHLQSAIGFAQDERKSQIRATYGRCPTLDPIRWLGGR